MQSFVKRQLRHFNCHCKPDFVARLVGFSCQLPLQTKNCSHGWFLFHSFVILKDKIFFTTAIAIQISLFAWLVKLFHINQTKTIFLVRLRCSNMRLTRKLFHIRQTKLACYQPNSLDAPSMSPISPSYLVVLITSKRGKLISAGTLATVVASYVVLIS